MIEGIISAGVSLDMLSATREVGGGVQKMGAESAKQYRPGTMHSLSEMCQQEHRTAATALAAFLNLTFKTAGLTSLLAQPSLNTSDTACQTMKLFRSCVQIQLKIYVVADLNNELLLGDYAAQHQMLFLTYFLLCLSCCCGNSNFAAGIGPRPVLIAHELYDFDVSNNRVWRFS
jgi:hypothetical protein